MSGSLPVQIAKDIIADYIDNHLIKPGERLSSVRELKARYMTTNTTICSALTILEHQGYVRKIHGKGIFVTVPDKAGEGGQVKILGAILPQPIGSSMVGHIYLGIERNAREYGYQLMLAISNEDYAEERKDVQRLREAGCQGIVLLPMLRLRDQLRGDYLAHEFLDYPIVLIDMAFPEQKRSQVILDNFRAGYDMAHWLLGLGHRRIAFMDWKTQQGEIMSRSVRDRYRGYQSAFKKAGLAPDPADSWRVTYPGYGVDPTVEARALLEAWTHQADRPTALMAFNDDWALHMMNVAADLGLAVPQDLTITGFDNTPSLYQPLCPFPTTNPNFQLVGELAVDLLMQHIGGELEGPVTYIQPAPLLESSLAAVPARVAGL